MRNCNGCIISDCEAGENHARATDILRFARFDEDPVRSSRQQPRKVGLAHRQRQSAEIVTGERHDVEGVQLHLLIVLAGMQRVESAKPSTLSTTASPSTTNCLDRFFSAASTIHG